MATEPASLVQDGPTVAGSHPQPETEPVDYAALNVLWGALLTGVVLATREGARKDPISGPELIPLSAATFALSKVIAREKIGAWVREPFVEEEPYDGERPRGRRIRRAVGELLTCTRCVGAWSALGIVGLRLASPSSGRAVTNVLAASAANDFLQAGFRAICGEANRLNP
jgi:Protein of unknown function (DUF1360)